jgi:ArsR family transcriptional regulator, arsenate/arsenite/antimonite-responsive transcriptional repressor / arsenate reductase (thioredoxin)
MRIDSRAESGKRGVRRRAAVHAALGEPARLRIVDRLSMSDATPGELQRLLGMPSNLVAHHLRVLEAGGLLRRHRSEGDRRRSYVGLVPGALDDLLPETRIAASRVVFVCTANTARSQLAAALWNQASDVPATSAGTNPADTVAPGAVQVARRRRLPLRQVVPQTVEAVVTGDDSVVTVCDNAHEELQGLLPAGRQCALHWSVPDPVLRGTAAAFDAAYDDLAARIARLAPSVTVMPKREVTP